jgi:hypothetical protein
MTTPERKSREACGARTELAKNENVRITRCACGAIHLHFARTGVSLQLSEEAFRDLTAASNEGLRDLEVSGQERSRSVPDTCIN